MLDAVTGLSRHRADTLAAIEAICPTEVFEFGSRIAGALGSGGKVIAAGNGGSAAMAQHLVSELLGRFGKTRRGLPAVALCADSATTTAIANDFGYEQVFARQLCAYAQPDDVFLPISTSGKSQNLLVACDSIAGAQVHVMSLTGPAPNPLAQRSDGCLHVEAATTAAIQEAHLTMIHMLCRIVDDVA